MYIKKGDKVQVLSGKDRGKQGVVLRALPAENKVVVEGVSVVKKAVKPNAANQQGGIVSQEAPIAIDPAPHPISSTDSPGFNANSFIKSRAYGAVSRGRKCRARLSHSKESSARCRAACRRIHSPFQSAASSSERISPSTTGQPPHTTKKAAPPKRRAATSIYQKKNRSNAKPPHQPSGAGAKQLQPG